MAIQLQTQIEEKPDTPVGFFFFHINNQKEREKKNLMAQRLMNKVRGRSQYQVIEFPRRYPANA